MCDRVAVGPAFRRVNFGNYIYARTQGIQRYTQGSAQAPSGHPASAVRRRRGASSLDERATASAAQTALLMLCSCKELERRRRVSVDAPDLHRSRRP